jgi:hypothetical protein
MEIVDAGQHRRSNTEDIEISDNVYRFAVRDETLGDSVIHSLSHILKKKKELNPNTVLHISMEDIASINMNSSMIPRMRFPFSFDLNNLKITVVCVDSDEMHVICLICDKNSTGETK